MPRDIATPAVTPVVVRMSEIEPKPLRWLWPDRIPLGKLTLIAGDPGRGKSLLTIDIAARITTGRGFPDGTPACEPGSVLFISAEDDLADTVRPRLDAAGADPSRISAMQAVSLAGREHHVTLGDIDAIAAALDGMHEPRLVVIDPISAYLGDADDHKNAQVRAVLAPLCRLASDRGVAVVAVTHLRKGDGPAMYRSMGSLGFVATARCAWLVTKHPSDPDLCAIARVKGNVGRDPGGLAYRVIDDLGAPVVEWQDGVVDVEMEPTGEGGSSRTLPRDEAARWLRGILADGPVAVSEIRERAEGEGIAFRTIERAKADMELESSRAGGIRTWAFPATPPLV